MPSPPLVTRPCAFVLLALVGILLFAPTLGHDFVFDDTLIIKDNPLLEHVDEPWLFFLSDYWGNHYRSGDYRPLTMLSYALNAHLFGIDPFSFHLVNHILHILNTLLWLFLLLKHGHNRRLAWAAALLFLVHPVHTEAVVGIVGRAELLATTFSLLACWFALTPGISTLFFAACLYGFAMLSKENAAMLPVYLALWSWYRYGRMERRVLALLPSLLLVALLKYQTLGTLGPTGAAVFYQGTDLVTRFWAMLEVFLVYTRLLLLPVRLCADYSGMRSTVDPLAPVNLLGITLLLGLISAMGWTLLRRHRASFAVSCVFASFLPIANLVPMGTNLGERLLYQPSLFALLLAAGLFGRSLMQHTTLFAIVLLFSGLTLHAGRAWKDSYTLFSQTVSVLPRSAKAQANLAIAMFERNDLDTAAQHLDTALALAPLEPTQAAFLAAFHLSRDNAPRAEALLRNALELQEHPLLRYDLGVVLLAQSRPEEASLQFHQAQVFLQRQRVVDRRLLARCYHQSSRAALAKGFHEDAEAELRRAVALAPELTSARQDLGAVLYLRGSFVEAKQHFLAALEDTTADQVALLRNLGLCDVALHNYEEAWTSFSRLLELSPEDELGLAQSIELGFRTGRVGTLGPLLERLRHRPTNDPLRQHLKHLLQHGQ